MRSVYFFLMSAFIPFMTIQAGVPAEVEQNILRHIQSNSWVGLYYDVLPPIIEQYQFKKVAEVGVALGGHAEHLLKNTTIDTYVGIDPYLYNDSADAFSVEVSQYSPRGKQISFDYLYQWVKETRLKPFGNRSTLIRMPSVEAAALYDDESFDCIFIDGDHHYAHVMEDLAVWFPKLKKGGMMLGDDYWISDVSRAVNEFFSTQEQYKVTFFTSAKGYKIWAVTK